MCNAPCCRTVIALLSLSSKVPSGSRSPHWCRIPASAFKVGLRPCCVEEYLVTAGDMIHCQHVSYVPCSHGFRSFVENTCQQLHGVTECPTITSCSNVLTAVLHMPLGGTKLPITIPAVAETIEVECAKRNCLPTLWSRCRWRRYSTTGVLPLLLTFQLFVKSVNNAYGFHMSCRNSIDGLLASRSHTRWGIEGPRCAHGAPTERPRRGGNVV